MKECDDTEGLLDVSVIVPIYNTEKYLNRCLKSLSVQNGINAEFICIDDGSTDASLSILHQYSKKDKRFIIVTQEHKGVSAARNTGLDFSKGKYVCFLDSDDRFCKGALSFLFNMAEKEHCDTIKFNAHVINGEKWMKKSFIKHDELIKNFKSNEIFRHKDCRPFVWVHFIRRKIIEDVRFNELLSLGEDQEFIIHYLTKVDIVKFCSKKLYYHYNNPHSSFNKIYINTDFVCKQHIIMVESAMSLIESNTYDFSIWVFDTLYTSFIESNKEEDNKTEIKDIFDHLSVEKHIEDDERKKKYLSFN